MPSHADRVRKNYPDGVPKFGSITKQLNDLHGLHDVPWINDGTSIAGYLGIRRDDPVDPTLGDGIIWIRGRIVHTWPDGSSVRVELDEGTRVTVDSRACATKESIA